MPRTTSAAATVLPIVAVLTALGAPRALGASVPARTPPPAITATNVERVAVELLAPHDSSEPDTIVEPHIVVDPNDPNVVVAAFQEGRFADGGSLDIGYATSHDGGRTWLQGPLPGLTQAVGGPAPRASDPSVAFGSDGSVYVTSLIVHGAHGCTNGVAVSRSDDGGGSFHRPRVVELNDVGCHQAAGIDDKSWIAVDRSPGSPHLGRVYVVWDFASFGGGPVKLRYSDDRGRTWSPRVPVSGGIRTSGTDAITLVQPNGDVTVVYLNVAVGPNTIVAQTSHDGGQSFGAAVTIADYFGGEPARMRTGAFPTAAVDPVSGTMYVAWPDGRFRLNGLNDVALVISTDSGATWSPDPVRANPDPLGDGIDHLSPAIAAEGGTVFITYRTQSNVPVQSKLVGMTAVASTDGGGSFGPETTLGPAADIGFAAQAFGRFLGDYMGLSVAGGVAHAVWCVSGRPPAPAPYHQVLFGATLGA